MPTRMLRDCTDSESVNLLSCQAEVLFYRLIMKADDFGRYYGDVQLLKSYLFPRRDVRTADLSRWIAECEKSGLLVCYVGADGKPYAAIRNFKQRTRAKSSNFPEPPCGDIGGHVTDFYPSHAGQMTDTCRPETETETETETVYDIEHSGNKFPSCSSPEPDKSGSRGRSNESKIFFDYEGDAKIHGITSEQFVLWKENFPALNVEQELKSASAWLDGNRKNRKSDIKRFLVSWLNKAQNRAPKMPNQPPGKGTSRI